MEGVVPKTLGENCTENVSHGTSEIVVDGSFVEELYSGDGNSDQSKSSDCTYPSIEDKKCNNNDGHIVKAGDITGERNSQRIGSESREIVGSVAKISHCDSKSSESLGKIRGRDWKIGNARGRIGDSDWKVGGSVGNIKGNDEWEIGDRVRKFSSCGGKIGVNDGRINNYFVSGRDGGGTHLPTNGDISKVTLKANFRGQRSRSEGHEEQEGNIKVVEKQQEARTKVGRAFSFSPASRSRPATPATRGTPAAPTTSRLSRFIGRLFLRKTNSILPSFSQFLASYIFKPSFRKSSDLPETVEEMKPSEGELDETKGNDKTGDGEKERDETSRDYCDEECGARYRRSETKEFPGKDRNERYSSNDDITENNRHRDETEESTNVSIEDDLDEGEEKEEQEYTFGSGWVKKRVSQIERQISIKGQTDERGIYTRQKSSDSIWSHKTGGGLTSETRDDPYSLEEVDENEGSDNWNSNDTRDNDPSQSEVKEINAAETDNSAEDDSDTEVEEDEVGEIVVLRSKSRSRTTNSLYRYSDRPTSLYRYSVVRPRTIIIGLGVCTETKFFGESFGDGVSETESEDEEEDAAPITSHAAYTPTTPRSQSRPSSPSRMSRPHSPLSDMDTESKRNSQAVSTEPSDLEDHSSLTTSDLESCHDLAALDARKDKAYRIAHELLHTERTYVKVLHLIDQEFQFRVDHENRAHHMFPQEVLPHMFSNVKSIYKLHHDFLLPQLEERMAQWEQNRRIGDIMKSFAPFLKMYTEYVRNFDNAMTLINQWQSKCPRFAAIMDEIHSLEVCGNLTLQHHMLSPVQRIPRYEMLLRDYLKKLPEDSADRHDTEKALHLVSTAANHANDAMKKIDKFEKLLEIQESLGGAEDLVSPTRELIKEGKIIKISARSGDHQERYIFLLTDLLLLCSPRLMGGRVMSGPQYRLRAKYHVENLMVQEGDNLETANTFYIKDNNKSVELYTQTLEEKEQWLEAFIRAIHETSQRKSSLKLHFNPDQRVVDVDLGQKQPMLIRSDSVTKCMECGSQFTMVRRKHHCRACGAVVCSKCSSFKASLAYESGKSVRVCRTCHTTLQELSSSTATPSPEIDDADECSLYNTKEPPDLPFRNRGVLEVSAKTGGAVIQGFLQLKTHRKTWVKRWFALHTDFVLYSFKCEADDQALTATPVPGFTVTHLQGTRNESGISEKEKERAFKLHHSKKHYIFQAASKEESQRWVAALKKASQAELPSPVQ